MRIALSSLISFPARPGILTRDTSRRYKLRHLYAGRQKTLQREALLRRIRELDAEIAQHERSLREGEARLPVEGQLRLKLRRFIEANIPELTVNVRVDKRR